MCGAAADGPYQTNNFRRSLVEHVGTDLDDILSFPVTWDPGHLLNLAVTDVRDGETTGGSYIR